MLEFADLQSTFPLHREFRTQHFGDGILNKLGGHRFSACSACSAGSAGSYPAGEVNPAAIQLLADHSHDTRAFSSKSWDVFAQANAPQFDFVITVCDNAAGESCPLWPGQPLTVHWSIPDPATVPGSEQSVRQAFVSAFAELKGCIRKLIDLPLESMSRTEMLTALRAVGSDQGAN